MLVVMNTQNNNYSDSIKTTELDINGYIFSKLMIEITVAKTKMPLNSKSKINKIIIGPSLKVVIALNVTSEKQWQFLRRDFTVMIMQ